MNTPYPYRRTALMLLAAFFIWGGVSYYWYACGIKNLCVETKTSTSIVEQQTSIPFTYSTPPQTVIVYEPTPCEPYLTHFVGTQTKNDSRSVALVEQFLSVYRNENLIIDGIYGSDDVRAMRSFQKDYNIQPTGNVFQKTTRVINSLVCAQ